MELLLSSRVSILVEFKRVATEMRPATSSRIRAHYSSHFICLDVILYAHGSCVLVSLVEPLVQDDQCTRDEITASACDNFVIHEGRRTRKGKVVHSALFFACLDISLLDYRVRGEVRRRN